MDQYIFIVFLLLTIAVALSAVRRSWATLFRWVVTALSVGYFAFWFVERSSEEGFVQNSMAVQVISKLPQPVDFYLIKIRNTEEVSRRYGLKHLGNIRPEHYRLEYLDMKNADEFWVVGYLGKKNRVYFSQHSVPNKNMDQIIEVNNYINQSYKLSEIAGKTVDAAREQDIRRAVWVTLSFLLIFLNVILLFKKVF